MDKKQKLKRLNQEREYYDVEYLEKHKLNRLKFRDKIFTDIINALKDSNFEINQQANKITFIGINEIINVEQIADFEKKPKNPLSFKIAVNSNNADNIYQFRPFKDSPLPNPNFNRLLSNPYEGRDLIDVEIEEEQKNIDFLKRFITEKVDFKQYIYVCQLDGNDRMVEFKTITELIKYIRKK